MCIPVDVASGVVEVLTGPKGILLEVVIDGLKG
jgi:hypothetical protein